MNIREIELEIEQLVVSVRGLGVPDSDLDDVLQLARAGEPGIALENLCTQLFEYDVLVPQGPRAVMSSLAQAMGIAPRYVERLS